jgi:hypothetical protein
LVSGTALILSGLGVRLQSGEYVNIGSGIGVLVDKNRLSGLGVIVQSGVNIVGSLTASVSGQPVKISGEASVIGGVDYIQSGQAIRTVTAMRALESQVSGFEGSAGETRLFTGADTKHIRFHEIFDGTYSVDYIKWSLDAGSATVASSRVDIFNASTESILRSKERFLYGVLSFLVNSDNISSVVFGFVGSYSVGTGANVSVNYGNIFLISNPTLSSPLWIGFSPALSNNTWYNIEIVWTPSYVQLWVNNVLRSQYSGPYVPMEPANIIFYSPANTHLYVASVSLRPYGDIPLTVKGAVPVAGSNLSGEYVPIAVDSSGQLILQSGTTLLTQSASGEQLRLSGLYVAISGQGILLISGQTVLTQSTSGERLRLSGQGVLVSGQGVRLQSGEYVNVGSGVGVTITSGLGVVAATPTPQSVKTLLSGNPLQLNSESGGIQLVSTAAVSVIVRSLYNRNSGDIYIGGSNGSDMPYSGHGFVLEKGDAIALNLDSPHRIRAFAATSGEWISYLAVA